jgi:hypothetical protein
MANFKILSRYTGGLVSKTRSNKDFVLLRTPLNLEPDEGDIFITITQELIRRPDLISSQYYDTPELWWVIYEFNGISDPLFELKIGDILRVPELERVLVAVENLETT